MGGAQCGGTQSRQCSAGGLGPEGDRPSQPKEQQREERAQLLPLWMDPVPGSSSGSEKPSERGGAQAN